MIKAKANKLMSSKVLDIIFSLIHSFFGLGFLVLWKLSVWFASANDSFLGRNLSLILGVFIIGLSIFSLYKRTKYVHFSLYLTTILSMGLYIYSEGSIDLPILLIGHLIITTPILVFKYSS